VSAGFDALDAVRNAVAIVCQVEPGGLTRSTRLDDVGADSLSRVSIADLLEAWAAEDSGELHIDDAALCRMSSVGDLADYAAGHLATLRVAS
jgi:acyl carrier protein